MNYFFPFCLFLFLSLFSTLSLSNFLSLSLSLEPPYCHHHHHHHRLLPHPLAFLCLCSIPILSVCGLLFSLSAIDQGGSGVCMRVEVCVSLQGVRQIKHFNYTQACRWQRVQAAVVFQGQQRGKVKAKRTHGFGTNTKRHKYYCLNTRTGTHQLINICVGLSTHLYTHTHILPKQALSSSAHRSALPKHMFTELNNMHVLLVFTNYKSVIQQETIFLLLIRLRSADSSSI